MTPTVNNRARRYKADTPNGSNPGCNRRSRRRQTRQVQTRFDSGAKLKVHGITQPKSGCHLPGITERHATEVNSINKVLEQAEEHINKHKYPEAKALLEGLLSQPKLTKEEKEAIQKAIYTNQSRYYMHNKEYMRVLEPLAHLMELDSDNPGRVSYYCEQTAYCLDRLDFRVQAKGMWAAARELKPVMTPRH